VRKGGGREGRALNDSADLITVTQPIIILRPFPVLIIAARWRRPTDEAEGKIFSGRLAG
jgi:hypothetical protein